MNVSDNVVSFDPSFLCERKRLRQRAADESCDALTIAVGELLARSAEVARLRTLLASIVFQHGAVLRQPLLDEAERLVLPAGGVS